MNVLIARSGVLEGNTYAIAGRVLVGRDADCDIQVMDPAASRKHASVLAQEDGSVVLRDLKSHNGTLVRGEAVREVTLKPGDEVVFGTTRFEFQVIDTVGTPTQEVDLHLVSGPAQEPTVVGPVPAPDAITQNPAPSTQAPPAVSEVPTETYRAARLTTCCDNPLSTRARMEGWRYCPACGATIEY